MKNSKWLDFVVGIFVLSGIVAFTWLAFNASNATSGLGGGKPIQVTASFTNIGSLKVKAPVMIAGVRVGQVAGINLDHNNYEAVVSLSLDSSVPIPQDTIAAINTSGLVGEQYIALDPGGSEKELQNGDKIRMTQDAFVMERLIGQLMASFGSGGKGDTADVEEKGKDAPFKPASLLD
ncbi:outer membrane lipid asymmetry maintenance protein MlaD [Ignatzschineria larvae DSM 13226]|uniref:Outer membrane lipid asymmetry maintenance protein MlaD n=1 Tax=Ignatzschineria larvae DSM 13226 TaxID=1111732 RepID=A0ABZ3C078_9GAMM|nr:outer membrane lipid asymmetry maintenance protein MlaD [Ignatzschineria larvae]